MKALALAFLAALAGCSAPVEAQVAVETSAVHDGATVALDAPDDGRAVRTSFMFCSDEPMVLEAAARWNEALAKVASPYGPSSPPIGALRRFCGTKSVAVVLDAGLFSRTGHEGYFQVPDYIMPEGAVLLDPSRMTVGLVMHELGHALGLRHAAAGIMRPNPEGECVDAEAASHVPGADSTCSM